MNPTKLDLRALGALAMVLALATGCDMGDASGEGGADGDGDGGLGGGGPSAGTGSTGTGTGSGDPLVGEVDSGDGPSPTATGSVGAGGGGGGVGAYNDLAEPLPDAPIACVGCCTDVHVPGTEMVDVRVGDSNSFASPLLVEALLPDWNGEAPLPVRKDDFLNLFAPDLAQPADDDALVAWDAGAARFPSPSGETLLTFQVAVRDVSSALGPRAVGVLVDTSRSAAAAPDAVIGAFEGVMLGLREEDAVGVFSVTDGVEAKILRPFERLSVEPIDVAALATAVRDELEASTVKSETGAALLDALVQVQTDAAKRNLPEASLVVVSDGRTAVSDEILEKVAEARAADLPARVVGVGVGAARSFSDDALDRLTTAGGGAYVYFDGSDAAASFLADRVDELFSVAHPAVRLELALPSSIELVLLEGGAAGSPEGVGGTVYGQALAAGGTMTFHHLLRWTGTDPVNACATIGWKVKSRLTDAEGGDRELASGEIVLGNALAGVLDSVARHQGSAVVAAASAFQGPTPARLANAVLELRSAREAMESAGQPWQDHPLSRLCAAVSLACARIAPTDGDPTDSCSSCDLVDQP